MTHRLDVSCTERLSLVASVSCVIYLLPSPYLFSDLTIHRVYGVEEKRTNAYC
jgi:hypothetical protein